MFVRFFLFSLCALLFATWSTTAVPKYSFSSKFFNFTRNRKHGETIVASMRNGDSSESVEFDENQADKIYGGSYAALGQFPFMAVVHRLAGDGDYFVCGGTILSRRWVLTAAHCVNDKPQKFLVVFGAVDKSDFGYDYIGKEGVAMISNQGAVYPGYGEGEHDIALLYMPKDIPFSDTIQPIRLAGASYKSQSFQGKMAHIYGWGKAKQDGRAIAKLKYGRVPIISNNNCRLTWNVDGTHICTDSSTNNDVCQGDSGGPLVVMESDDEPLQVGIVSYGDAGCPSTRPSVFTRVSAYTNWIKKVTGISYQ